MAISGEGKKLTNLLEKNKNWSEKIRENSPDFFPALAKQQAPDYLWIGCSDSRVPANEIVGLLPGELFVHRNVANVVVHADLNCLSVIQYAVEVLKVDHIIVCGHYGCGGVHAAVNDQSFGLIDNWLRHVQDVVKKHELNINHLSETSKVNRVCELNVIEQVLNVSQTTVVQQAWARDEKLTVHGWIYGLQDGLIRDLQISVSSKADLQPVYEEAIRFLQNA